MGEDISDLTTAYYYVRDNWRTGDAVAACHPAPSQWILGRTDYYAIEYGAGIHDGVDKWAGAPLIDSSEKFATVLDSHTRVWYVADDLCWESYLGASFRQFVQQNMRVVFKQSGVQVFTSKFPN